MSYHEDELDDLMDEWQNRVECVYCGATNLDTAIPALGDDVAWAAEMQRHTLGCEWVQTRAHRRDSASA